MDEEAEEDSLSLLSLKDFEERGINVRRKWTGLQALTAVTSLASEKLKEESIRKETVNNPVDGILNQHSVFEKGSSSGLSSDPRPAMKKLVNDSVYDNLCSKKELGFYNNNQKKLLGDAMKSSTQVRDWENDDEEYWVFECTKKKNKFKRIEEEDSICDNLYSKKGLGFTRKKILGEVMKGCIRINSDLGLGNDDKEWVAQCRKQRNKFKSNEKKDSKSYKRPKREKQIVLNVIIDDLSEQFKERIKQLKGSKIGLVIEKRLFKTDVCDDQCRLSIPANQIMSSEFLTDDEKIYLDNGGWMEVKYFIEPSLQEYGGEMIFKRQGKLNLDENSNKKKNKKAKSSFCYLLITGWVKVKKRNNLECNDKIQLWKFRTTAEELCFALVLVEKFCEANNKNLGDDECTREGM